MIFKESTKLERFIIEEHTQFATLMTQAIDCLNFVSAGLHAG